MYREIEQGVPTTHLICGILLTSDVHLMTHFSMLIFFLSNSDNADIWAANKTKEVNDHISAVKRTLWIISKNTHNSTLN